MAANEGIQDFSACEENIEITKEQKEEADSVKASANEFFKGNVTEPRQIYVYLGISSREILEKDFCSVVQSQILNNTG